MAFSVRVEWLVFLSLCILFFVCVLYCVLCIFGFWVNGFFLSASLYCYVVCCVLCVVCCVLCVVCCELCVLCLRFGG